MSTPGLRLLKFGALAGVFVCLAGSRDATARPRTVRVARELHAAPSAGAPVLGELDAGSSVPFLVRRGQWVAVRARAGLAWALALEGLDPETVTDGATCGNAGDLADPKPHDRVEIVAPTRLRTRLGRDLPRDRKLARGAFVRIHTSGARDGEWILVQTAAGATGWCAAASSPCPRGSGGPVTRWS